MDCSICGSPIGKDLNGWGGGHNAWPINEGRCCGSCNDMEVFPARLDAMGLGTAMKADGYSGGEQDEAI